MSETKPKKHRPPRQEMPQQEVKDRVKNFNEVPLGYTPEMAVTEASRCLQCKKPLCVEGCPVNINIPAFIKLILEGDFVASARKIKEDNNLPAICGRVCPQEDQCEKACVLGKKGEPVAIGRLERFVADYERDQGEIVIPEIARPTGKSVAIVGSGPAGLTVAGDLIKLGHRVVIFEALHLPGGVLVYGIPEFRLPKAIVQAEVDYLKKMGVEVQTDMVIGKIETVDELLGEFDAVFIGTGAGLPQFLNIPGENSPGVYSANEYLTRSNLMKAYLFPEYDTPVARRKNVAVIGAGNVAMDAARTAVRLGAENVHIVYRRSEAEMPARIEEIERAKEEGVNFNLLMNPVKILSNGEGWVEGMECIRMRLGEPGPDGRRRPIPIPGSEFIFNVDAVIVALGNRPNPLVPSTTPGLKISSRGTIIVDEETEKTTKEGVYAGGDIVTGAATVISAMGAGKRAAKAIHEYICGLSR